jgi:hypothetical protein
MEMRIRIKAKPITLLMILFLKDIKDNEGVYSFGKIIDIKNLESFEVEYKDVKKSVVYQTSSLRKGDWVRFYGFHKNNEINASFLEAIKGIDPELLERAIVHIKRNHPAS